MDDRGSEGAPDRAGPRLVWDREADRREREERMGALAALAEQAPELRLDLERLAEALDEMVRIAAATRQAALALGALGRSTGLGAGQGGSRLG